jgi:hypothetical protein
MILVDVRVPLEHIKVMGSNIGPELIEKYRDVQNEQISGKKLRVLPKACFVKHRHFFLRLKKAFSRYLMNIVHSIYW